MRKTIMLTLALAFAPSAAGSGEADFVTNVKLCVDKLIADIIKELQ